MFRFLKYLFILLFLTVLLLPPFLAFMVLQDEPLVSSEGELSVDDLARAEALVRANDPRQWPAGTTQTLELPEQDINLMMRYGLAQFAEGAVATDLHSGRATLYASVMLPVNPFAEFIGSWVNVNADVSQVSGRLYIDYLDIGGLQVPYQLANEILKLVDTRLRKDDLYQAVLNSINGVRLTETQLMVLYQWQPDLVDRVKSRGKSLLISPEEKERLLAYAERIAEVSKSPDAGRRMRLHTFMSAVFELASQRGGDAVAENRAAINALAFYVNGISPGRLLEATDPDYYEPEPREVVLQGRGDFSQHFLVSAVLTSSGGSKLADAVGLFKEVDDSKGGSGFSFTDLAADRAGVRFAEVATASASKAQAVQAMIAQGLEDDYMPQARDLPEFMDAEVFAMRYGGVDDPRYQAVAGKIEQRIADLRVNKP